MEFWLFPYDSILSNLWSLLLFGRNDDVILVAAVVIKAVVMVNDKAKNKNHLKFQWKWNYIFLRRLYFFRTQMSKNFIEQLF